MKNLGIAYLRFRQFEASLNYFNQALEIAENEEHKVVIVKIWLNVKLFSKGVRSKSAFDLMNIKK